jgi:TPR repeat protein
MRLFETILALVAITLASPLRSQPLDETATTSNAVLAQSAWVKESQYCPTQVFPSRETLSYLAKNDCKPGQFSQCLSKCSAGEPGACYWLGQELQKANADQASAQALYQRSCKLGVVSGCTNRAAGMLRGQPTDKKAEVCTASTFAKACEYDDPWACTMYAMQLGLGQGVKRDKGKALKALKKSCKYGPEDEACSASIRLRKAILEAPEDAGPKR